jgi:hypothetical protein
MVLFTIKKGVKTFRAFKKGVQNYGKFGYPKGLNKKLFEKWCKAANWNK